MTRSRTGNKTTCKSYTRIGTAIIWHYLSIHLAPREGWGALLALLDGFGPLFSSRKCKTEHAQFCVKIGPYDIFRVK